MVSSYFAFLSLFINVVGLVSASPVPNPVVSDASVTATAPCNDPTLSSDPSKWSTKAYIDQYLKPIEPTPVYWSGFYKNQSIVTVAEGCATTLNGTTIGQLMCKKGGFTMPDSTPSPAGTALWAYASEVFAQNTKGEALTVIGDVRVTTIWFDDEFPALKSNRNVTSIVAVNPDTCKRSCYWYCPDVKTTCPVSFLSVSITDLSLT